MSHEEALKLDVLMGLQKEGWNLKETDDPATLSMNIGTGYTLFASVNKPWYILFDDGVEKTEYPIDSERVPFTNRKDVNKLWGKFEAGAHRVQRVPKTESQGRVHTSAATVAVMPMG